MSTTPYPIGIDELDALMEGVRPAVAAHLQARRPGCVEGAIKNAVLAAQYFENNDEPDTLLVVAYLMRSLVSNHCFGDGNKRIAWLAALRVLEVHAEASIVADQEEAAQMVLRLAVGTAEVEELVEWIAAHLVALADLPPLQ